MAGKKISELTALGTTFATTDLFEISKDMGGGTFASRKITGAELSSSISVSLAIGDTITSATAGSVLFAGAAGVLAQDNANFFWDDTNNRLGIGTASPGFALHVLNASSDLDTKVESNGGHSRFIIDSTGTDDSILQFNEANARRWSIYTDGTDDSLKITRSDVPTASPTSDAIAIDSSDNVSIPNGTLTINDYTFPAADGSANQIIQTDGAGNLSFAAAGGGGASDLDGLTDCKTQDSTSAGRFSIWIANGTTAGGAAQTGTLSDARGNLCIGASAGKSITSADYCVLLGQEAGDAVTTGGQNTVMGGFALSAVSTGSQNTAIGYAALQQASTAVIKNTAIGAFSMQGAAVTGAENAALGYGSLQNCAAGQKNAAFGALSLYSLDSGITNAVIGYRAGYANTSGSQNLYLGAYAAGVNTGSYQMSLGYNVATTQSSSLALGRSGQILLHGDYATAGQTKLGVNLGNTWTAPTATLEIKGQGTTNATTNLLIKNSGGNQIMKLTDSGDNIGIGYQALDDITAGSGTDNVAIGYQAGTAVTTGDYNVLLGYQAGLGFTTNGRNICIGYRAGAAAAVNDLVAIGYRAGETTTGSANTFIGRDAGKDNDAESNNCYMGYHAGRNLNARENVAIGAYAMEGNGSNLAAWRSVAIGYQALTDVTTGDNNVAIGLKAGDSITTGSSNTFIGDEADGAATGTNQIACGNGAVASGSNVGIWGNASVATNNITVDWTVTSDERIKENIEDASLGLDFINALKPKTYTKKHPADWDEAILEPRFKEGGSEYDEEKGEPIKGEFDTEKVHNGLIAQEVKAAMDSLGVSFSGWNEDSNGKQGIQYAALVMPLIKAVQELSARVKELENK